MSGASRRAGSSGVKRILLLAATTGYQTRAFGEAAEHLGVDLIFATDRCDQIEDPWHDHAIPIRFYDEDASVRAVIDATRHRSASIDGLVTVGDRPTVIAARVAQALGLPGHPPEAAAIARNKLRTRERLRAAGLPSPQFRAFPLSASFGDHSIADYPVVVKPLALSGSRGVMRADDTHSLEAAVDRLRAILRSPQVRAERNPDHQTILVESFIPGREYALEGVLDHGTLYVHAIFDKPDPLDGPFFEETIYVTPSSAPQEAQDEIRHTITRAAAAIGLCHGPIHAECRVNERGVFVLEIAARPIGGLCSRAIRLQEPKAESRGPRADCSLEEWLLRHALGESPRGWTAAAESSGVMMIPIPRRGTLREVTGVDAARSVTHVTDVRITAKIDQLLVPLPEGASYLGFIFARAPMAAAVESALRSAHQKTGFRIDPDLEMVPQPTSESR